MKEFLNRLGQKFSLPDRRAAYRNFRRAPHAADILADLAEYTAALEPAPATGDLFVQGRFAGRRDVFLRIMQHCHLTEEELFNLYAGRPLSEKKD